MTIRHGLASGANSATGRGWSPSTTMTSPACSVRGTSPLASRAWRESSMETMAGATGDGVALGVEAGPWSARRSVGASRASLGVTRLLYAWERRHLIAPQIRHQDQ